MTLRIRIQEPRRVVAHPIAITDSADTPALFLSGTAYSITYAAYADGTARW